jgi:DNA-directed RNA polymerase subunit H
MSEIEYNEYKNIFEFATKWRGYTLAKNDKESKTSNPIYEWNEFRTKMQTDQYIKMEFLNSNSKTVLIYFLAKNSRYNNNQILKQLLVKIKDPADVILITEMQLKKYAYDSISMYKHIRVNTYLHRHFDIIMPNAPLVYRHRIMFQKEVYNLLNNELCCSLINLPKINVEDVQCIWIGAEVGDVIEITNKSDIAGESTRYHVVVPKSGRVISFRQKNEEEEKKEEEEEPEAIDDIVEDESASESEEAEEV